MAPETKSNKRKGAVETAPKPKKQKKSDETAAANKASAKALSAAVKPLDDVAPPTKISKASRKRAEDFFDEDQLPAKPKKAKKAKADAVNGDAEVAAPEATKKTKKSKAVEVKEVSEPAAPSKKSKDKKPKAVEKEESEVATFLPPAVEHISAKKGAAGKKQKKTAKEPSPEPVAEEAEDDDEDVDDQTAALLAGFESDRDESDLEKEDEEIDEAALQAKIPKKLSKELKKASGSQDKPGVIYIGRIPHGFYEPQMRAYFSQFGKINKLRLSRNKKTGASKHYAFVEFASAEVADIVARTMHNYLMFGRILQCKVVPDEQVHKDLFKGANERFKVVPRNKMAGLQMERGTMRDVWEKRVEAEAGKRKEKSKMLAEKLGYEFEAPELKGVGAVPKKAIDAAAEQLLLEAPAEDVETSVLTTTSTPAQLTVTETKKTKKGKKAAQPVVETEIVVEESIAEPAPEVVEKPKKGKKRQSDVAAEESPAKAEKPAKKAKKAAKADDVAVEVEAAAAAKPKKAKKAKA